MMTGIDFRDLRSLSIDGKEISHLVDCTSGMMIYQSNGRIESPAYFKLVNSTHNDIQFKIYVQRRSETFIEVEYENGSYDQYKCPSAGVITTTIRPGTCKLLLSYGIWIFSPFNAVQNDDSVNSIVKEFHKTDPEWDSGRITFGCPESNTQYKRRCYYDLEYADMETQPTYIYSYKYVGCNKLSIPRMDLSQVTYIGVDAFPIRTQDLQQMPKCTFVGSGRMFDEATMPETLRMSDYFRKDTSFGSGVFADNTVVKTLIWDLNTSLPSGLFNSGNGLEEVYLESGAQTVGNYCFGWIYSVKRLIWVNPVTTSFGDVFYGSNNLEFVDMRCYDGLPIDKFPKLNGYTRTYYPPFGNNVNLKIVVPDSLYDQILTYTDGWASYANWIVKASNYQE